MSWTAAFSMIGPTGPTGRGLNVTDLPADAVFFNDNGPTGSSQFTFNHTSNILTVGNADAQLEYDNTANSLSIVSNNAGPFPQIGLSDTVNGVALNITTSNITYTPGTGTSEQFTFNIPSTLVSGHVLPTTTNVYDLGSADLQWRDIHLSSGSIYMSTSKLSVATDGNLQLAIGANPAYQVLNTINLVF